MDKLECYTKLTKLDEQRTAVESAITPFLEASRELTTALKNAAADPSDMTMVDALNDGLAHFNRKWTELDAVVTTWDNTMRKFSKEVLDAVQQRIKRDKTLKDIQTACDPIVVYAAWSEREVKPLRGLLDVWRNYRDMVTSFAEAWGSRRVAN